MNPNHYLAVAIWYLFTQRKGWSENAKIGKTLVSSALIDRVARKIGRDVVEVPVGFKWFVDGLYEAVLALVARKARALPSCVVTAASGQPTRMA